MKKTLIRLTFAVPVTVASLGAWADESVVRTRTPSQRPPPTANKGAPGDPKVSVDKGLAWLAAHQLQSGGFGQGEEAARMGMHNAAGGDHANVADTSMAAL